MLLVAGPYHWPVGAELHVNSYTPYAQSAPSMAMDADGDFVVAWTSNHQDGSGHGVFAQRYSSAGTAQGAEFRVNTHTTGNQWSPSAAISAEGDFVIAWGSDGQDGSALGVYAQRYNAAGVAQGAEFRVNTTTPDAQQNPTVAMDADGDFVIAWESGSFGYYGVYSADVYAQRYNASGVKQGSEFQVDTFAGGFQLAASAAMDADGNFVITWHSRGQSGHGDGIYAQRFNTAAVTQGSEFRVDTYTSGSRYAPSAAMDADGDFVITWSSNQQDESGEGVYAQRFNAAGVTQGSEFRVNTYTTGNQWESEAAMDAAGEFVITWQSGDQDGSGDGVYAQRYSAIGAAESTEFRVNSHTNGGQWLSSAAMDADGDFVVAWTSYQDGGSQGVCAQRFTTFGPAGAATIGDRVWNDSNANGIQDAGESGIGGARVELFSAGGAGVASVNTSTTGQYSFPVLAGASAYLRFVMPSGLLTTHQNRGANDELDSDVDRVTGLSRIFTAGAAGAAISSADAGFCLPGFISGTAFFDRSGDGVRNGGEEGLTGFEVFMDLDADGMRDLTEPSTTTNFDGSYGFGSLLGDTYQVGIVDQEQWVEPALSPFFLMPGTSSPTNLPLQTSAHDSTSARIGSEFRLNSTTNDSQSNPSTAMDDNGNFVVAWRGAGEGDSIGIFAQRYNVAGVKQGSEFRVNSFVNGNQVLPSVAMNANGDFVIAWFGRGSGDDIGIFAQRYNAAGVKQGTQFRVNTYTTREQEAPSVAMDADGDFVIAWHSYGQDGGSWGIYAQRYNAGGVREGAEFHVNTYIGRIFSPNVAMDGDGDFVIAWSSYGQDGAYSGIFAQRYDESGVPQADEFRVNTSTARNEYVPSVAMDTDGDFVVAWGSALHITPPYSEYDIYVQRYNASGVPQGTEVLVNSHTTDIQAFPKAAIDGDGNFIVTWTSLGQESGYGVFGQRYNAAGVAQGTETLVNSHGMGDQIFPSVAMDPAGNYVVAWMGEGEGDSDGVYAQRFSVSPRPTITASSFVWQHAPPRIEFTFDQDVSASLTASGLVLKNLTTGATIPTNQIVRSWNAATKTATFTFPSLPNGGSLPDGSYRATLPAAGVRNSAGTTIAVDHALDFFFLAGDANRDGRVNLQDFNILAANFGQSGRDFARGDFNYDTVVNLADFNLLASRFGQTAASPTSRGESSFSDGRTEDASERRPEELI